MRHAVLMCFYNQLALTKIAVESMLAQDVEGGVHLFLVNNGSTDGTREWLDSIAGEHVTVSHMFENTSPVKIANMWLGSLFSSGHKHVLTAPNDIIAPPNLYREMLRWPRGLVSAWMTGDINFPRDMVSKAVHEEAHLSVCLIRSWVYEALVAKDGSYFDEITQVEERDVSGKVIVPQKGYFFYASDCDLKLKFQACGIHGLQLDILCWHYGSASWRLAPPAEGRAMNEQADRDRAYFTKKWGFAIGDPQYGVAGTDVNWRGERVDGL